MLMSGQYSGDGIDARHHEHPHKRHGFRRMSKHHFNTAGLKMVSAYAAAHGGQEPKLTTCTPSFSGCLDYIWLTSANWHVTEVLRMPRGSSHRDQNGKSSPFPPIPNAHFPSDHLVMACKAVLRK